MTLVKTITRTAAAAGILAMVGAVIGSGAAPAIAGDHSMSFFVTSVGMGDGANLGGLDGADAHCALLAKAAGSKGRTWRGLSLDPGRGQARHLGARSDRQGTLVQCRRRADRQ